MTFPKKNTVNNSGFTLLELLIATTIFSVILLLCTYGLIQIGNTYYQGATAAHNQDVARSIMDNISQSVQFGGADLRSSVSSAPDANGKITIVKDDGSPGAFCMGSVRYRYQKNVRVDSSSWGLVVDNSSAGGCSYAPPVSGEQTKELLGKGMRIVNLDIALKDDNYTINLKVGSGEDDQFDGAGQCKVDAGRRFCSTSTLTTTVQRRIK